MQKVVDSLREIIRMDTSLRDYGLSGARAKKPD
jgi:hypothetical protein